jgi:protein SCO1
MSSALTPLPFPSRVLKRAWQAGSVLLVAAALAGCGGSGRSTPAPASSGMSAVPGVAGVEAKALHGLIPAPLPAKPSFTLTDTSGHPYRFAAATRGKLTYLYFGYTHCPDACPATMSEIAYALRLQPPAVQRRISVVFVTVDPRRDTEPVLRTWLDHYSHTFIGLTGTEQQVETAERAAGLPTTPDTTHAGLRYPVAHSSVVFPYSPRDDRAHVIYTQGFKAGDYAHDMPVLVNF